ncbi:hypothetical protein KY290_010994 [Solanum tuberosum]|uniref:Retrotransposon Copia-like N-terminal domain-containing protein n=1 Tax=Solanum tuberosum TaxID=4113 RepID=A0ABQ7VZB8_SOLTU|nr:hypothetical protein KY290_010994 [Solanum tuberosum]
MKKLEDDFVPKKNEKVNTTFDGKSFGGWKRGMLIALTAKNKSGFIDGSTHEPVVGTDLHNAWSRANNMLQKELSDLVQGSSDIATYYTKMKRLWDELDALDFFIPCNCTCSCEAKEKNIKSKQDERLV